MSNAESFRPDTSSAAPARAEAAHALAHALKRSIGGRILGQHASVELLLLALLGGGHALLVGVPGLAKTLLVRTLADVLQLPFRRIQFTPDLMPSDIVGSDMLEGNAQQGMRLSFSPGPVFANVLLADEINRTPPKTQAALLECMQEHSVTVGGHVHALPRPFHVFATQNPLEQEGTYPLPEAQLDRFMLHVHMDYPSAATELNMARGTHEREALLPPQPTGGLLSALQDAQRLAPHVPVPEPLLQAIVSLVRSSRPREPDAHPKARQTLAFGAGPRGTQHLVRLCQTRALVHGRFAVVEQDVRALAAPTLRHRLLLSPEGEMDAGGDSMGLLDALIGQLADRALGAG